MSILNLFEILESTKNLHPHNFNQFHSTEMLQYSEALRLAHSRRHGYREGEHLTQHLPFHCSRLLCFFMG